MHRAALGGLSIKSALALGFGLTVALWLVTGYQFARSTASAEQESAATAARYVEAQEVLVSLRAAVLASSGIARDALLDRTHQPLSVSREQLRDRLATLDDVLSRYRPLLNSDEEARRLDRLRQEATRFGNGLSEALESVSDQGADGRERFRIDVLPLRTALLTATEDLQATNRSEFVQYQRALAGTHASAERSTQRQLGLVLLCSLGIAVLATLYAGGLEKHLVSQLQQDAVKTKALQDLSIRIIRAQEDERRRIAHELHDEVGQALTAIKVELSVAQRAMAGPGVSPAVLQSAQAITDDALHTVRDLSRLLHPAVLDDLGLPDAVDGYLREFSKRFDVRTDLDVEGMAARLPADVEVAAYRMIQEALTNVAKHAHATRCAVTLRRAGDRFEIEVTDDGTGFQPPDLERSSGRSGLGLIGMRERALQLAGVVSVQSEPGRGTTLRIVLQLGPDAPANERPDADLPAVASLSRG